MSTEVVVTCACVSLEVSTYSSQVCKPIPEVTDTACMQNPLLNRYQPIQTYNGVCWFSSILCSCKRKILESQYEHSLPAVTLSCGDIHGDYLWLITKCVIDITIDFYSCWHNLVGDPTLRQLTPQQDAHSVLKDLSGLLIDMSVLVKTIKIILKHLQKKN